MTNQDKENQIVFRSVLILCCLIFFIGYLFDATGSYQASLIVCGIFIVCLGINILADPLHERWQNKLDKKKVCNSLRDEDFKHVYINSVGAKKKEQNSLREEDFKQVYIYSISSNLNP